MGGAVSLPVDWSEAKLWSGWLGNGDLLQKCLCQDCCILCPWPHGSHCWSRPPLETLGPSQESLDLCLVGSLILPPGSGWAHSFVWALQAFLVGMVFDSKCNFVTPTILLGLLLCPWMCGIFFGGIQHYYPVNDCSVISYNFWVLTGEDEHMSFYSAIWVHIT